MNAIKDVIGQTTRGTILDFKVVGTYTCSGCDELITIRKVIMPVGPEKGKVTNIEYGCKCEEVNIVNQILQQREDMKKRRTYKVFDQNSLINEQLKKATFDNFHCHNDNLVNACYSAMQYAKKFNKEAGMNLIFSGSYGVGKSHLACSIANYIMAQGYTAIFISVPKLLTKLKATYNRNSEFTEDELLSTIETVDCLILDDIGAEYGTDHQGSWATAKVFEVVDSRMGRHTIYTTNLSGEALREKIGPRNFSRMMQDTEVITMHGEDYRLRNFK